MDFSTENLAFAFIGLVIILLNFYDKWQANRSLKHIAILRPRLPVIAPIISLIVSMIFLFMTLTSKDTDSYSIAFSAGMTLIFFILFLLNLFLKPLIIFLEEGILIKSKFKRDRVLSGIKKVKIRNFIFFYIIEIDDNSFYVFGGLSLDKGIGECSYVDLKSIRL